MKEIGLIREEMDRTGYSDIGPVLDAAAINWFRDNLLSRKQQQIELYGEDMLREKGEYDVLRALFQFSSPYVELVESQWLNSVVDSVLNSTATIVDLYGVLNTEQQNTSLTRYRYHRDQPWFKDTRTSITIFLPLIDTTIENGATWVIPGSHLLEPMPSDQFIATHRDALVAKAGSAIVMDAALWHCTGENRTGQPRPMFAIRFHLAFMRQPMDLCSFYQEQLPGASDLIKRRMGWNCRSNLSPTAAIEDQSRWQSGNYNMQNTKIS